jgi:uncharacterized membrane protein
VGQPHNHKKENMSKQKLHLHSMLVHFVVALAPLAAIAFIFLKQQVNFLSFDERTWSFFTVFSIVIIFLTTIPSILSGIFERGHVYAKWHTTHKAKMVYSLLLIAILCIELILMIQNGVQDELFSLLGILIIFGNNVIAFILGALGLKISMGRQSLAKTSYIPDLFKKDHTDILVTAGKLRKEAPKYIDLTQER